MPHYNGYSFLLYKNISLIFRISYCTKVNEYAGMLCPLVFVSYNDISEASVMKCTLSAHTGACMSRRRVCAGVCANKTCAFRRKRRGVLYDTSASRTDHTCISLTKLTADSEFSTYNIHMMYANFLHEITM